MGLMFAVSPRLFHLLLLFRVLPGFRIKICVIKGSCWSTSCIVQERFTRQEITAVVLLMSDPAHLFQSLHLDEMPVTRSQAHPTQQRGGRNARLNRGRGRGRARAPPPPLVLAQISPPGSTPVQSYTGRQYYTQALSPTSAQRAIEGLESNFCVDRVQSHDSGRERYYAFQLRTPVAVRIYEPTGGRARMECSCEAHRVTRSECAHIFVSLLPPPNSWILLMSISGSLLVYMPYSQTSKRRIHEAQSKLRCRSLPNWVGK